MLIKIDQDFHVFMKKLHPLLPGFITARIVHKSHELIPADAEQKIRRSQGLRQALAGGLQQQIADIMLVLKIAARDSPCSSRKMVRDSTVCVSPASNVMSPTIKDPMTYSFRRPRISARRPKGTSSATEPSR